MNQSLGEMFLLGGKSAAKPAKPVKPTKPAKPSNDISSPFIDAVAEKSVDDMDDEELEKFLSQNQTDMNDIINDASLQQELLELGWGMDALPAAKPTAKPQLSRPTAPPRKATASAGTGAPAPAAGSSDLLQFDTPAIDLQSLNNIGEVDESQIQLDEDDLQDPELLSMYSSLAGVDPHQDANQVEAAVAEPFPEPEPELLSPTTRSAPLFQEASSVLLPAASVEEERSEEASTPGYADLSIEEMKARALKFKREGNNAEALRWYRYVKQKEMARPAQQQQQPPPPRPARQAAAPPIAGPPQSAATPSSSSPLPTASQQSPALPSASATAASRRPVSTSTTSSISSLTSMTTVATARSAASSIPSTMPSAKSLPPQWAPSSISDGFTALEAALVEASKASLAKAKALRESQPKEAVAKKREYDHYQQELAVLISRREIPGACPALFRWEVDRKEVKVERLEIGETEIKVAILAVTNVESALKDHTSRELSVEVDLNLGTKDEAKVATPKSRYENGRAEFSYEVSLPILRRSKLVAQSFGRKKANFEITLHRGFFKSKLLLAVGTLPLNDLVNKTEIVGPFPLYAAAVDGEGKTKRGVAIGGALEARISIRTPMGGPEIMTVEERRLVVEAWPPISQASPTSLAQAPPPIQDATPISPSSPPVHQWASPTTEQRESPVAAAPAPSSAAPPLQLAHPSPPPSSSSSSVGLTDREKADPDAVDFLDSNDVLEAEIREVEGSIRRGMDEDEAFAAHLRLDLLRNKLQMLVFKVQNEELSLEDYLQVLRDRILRDKHLAKYFKDQGTPEGTAQALRIMKRVKVMQDEVKNAEEAV